MHFTFIETKCSHLFYNFFEHLMLITVRFLNMGLFLPSSIYHHLTYMECCITAAQDPNHDCRPLKTWQLLGLYNKKHLCGSWSTVLVLGVLTLNSSTRQCWKSHWWTSNIWLEAVNVKQCLLRSLRHHTVVELESHFYFLKYKNSLIVINLW